MAWVGDPKTWAFQEGVESSELNIEVRDRFLAMGPHFLVRKTSDETDSVGTLQNDDQLVTPSIPATEIWWLQWILIMVSASSGTFLAAATFPSGTFSGTVHALTENNMMSGTSSPTATATCQVNTATAGQVIVVDGVLANGGSAGAVTLQWARATSGSLTVKANSTLWGVKLA